MIHIKTHDEVVLALIKVGILSHPRKYQSPQSIFIPYFAKVVNIKVYNVILSIKKHLITAINFWDQCILFCNSKASLSDVNLTYI